MRKALVLLATLALAACLPSRASAALLPVQGTLSFAIGALGVVELSGSSSGTSNGPFALATLPAGALSLSSSVSVPIQPAAIGLSKLTVMASPSSPAFNHAGSFAPGGLMGNNAIVQMFFTNGGAAGVIPLRYVGGGTTMACVVPCQPLTILGARWTNLGASAADPTRTLMLMEAPAGIPVTLTVTAFDKRTAGGAGTLQLVAPALAKILGGNLGNLPLVGTLTLRFVPEPGTLLLLGSGVIALVAAGRRQARP
jgi:hypothetical protein